jgi:hypothetical protein
MLGKARMFFRAVLVAAVIYTASLYCIFRRLYLLVMSVSKTHVAWL